MSGGEVLDVRDLRVSFGSGPGAVEAVRGIGFSLRAGECLAIVGESGSGKSVTARALLGLAGTRARVGAARMSLGDLDLTVLDERQWRAVRGGRIGLVLQDALSSLDPVRTVGAEVGEAVRNHPDRGRGGHTGAGGPGGVRERVVGLLAEVHLPEPELRARQRPHQLSGGQRQRALIASALAGRPEVLIADEPTTALDVTVQAQILDLVRQLLDEGRAVLLISHDLAVVARLADRVAVMYRGVFVEEGPAEQVLTRPSHPYTRELLAASPGRASRGTRLSTRDPGAAPPPATGCAYATRCPLVTQQCRAQAPPRVVLAADHAAWCWRTDDEWPTPPPDATTREATTGPPVVEVTGVRKAFRGPDGVARDAVADVSFTVRAGEVVGLLGESGSGKSTIARLVLGLLEPDEGEVRVLGVPWSGRRESRRRPLRKRVQLVHQDSLGAFDPRHPVERIVAEALGASSRRAARRLRDRVVDLLTLVGLDGSVLDRLPRELSGGQRQRVAIARALATGPDVIVCDEPVSALDVCVQAQILDLFAHLRDRLGVALVFISHDLGVVEHLCDRVLVLRAGSVVESGPVDEVLVQPGHPYTRGLLAAVPTVEDVHLKPRPTVTPDPVPTAVTSSDPRSRGASR